MELDDRRLEQLEGIRPAREMHEPMDRSHYFRELLRLQGELVKLQDWIQHNKLKVVVIFEGRDSAGKGGVIKRITQRRNGIFSATSLTFRQAEKSCCSTVLGTIVPASSA
jgi:polyphosphate kinase